MYIKFGLLVKSPIGIKLMCERPVAGVEQSVTGHEVLLRLWTFQFCRPARFESCYRRKFPRSGKRAPIGAALT